ncbi:TIGR01244 family sulfur transferase [Thioclava sp. GXIMD4216]|uniref:TIGR01244 family sulfur transferase n=1 Tax=Thioclava litoralis TaxID=3076557 RepID=A0ABZ1DYH1_9RHOB|nr:TIGR01244 family sulfur transferase [Thioclava sp. FTW29]
MDIRPLSSEFAVSPQISLEDVSTLAEQGFRSLIINRPDEENPPELAHEHFVKAAAENGMTAHYLPFYPGEMTLELVQAFEACLNDAEKPCFAYCRSGTRSSHLWAMAQAGRMDIAEIVSAAASAGYDHRPLITTLASYAEQKA